MTEEYDWTEQDNIAKEQMQEREIIYPGLTEDVYGKEFANRMLEGLETKLGSEKYSQYLIDKEEKKWERED